MPLSDRFFRSINYDEAAHVGLTFLTYNKVGDIWHYKLQKETPWTFQEYEVFSRALSLIDYAFRVSYAYKALPTLNEVEQLFRDWYQSSTYLTFTLPLVHKNHDELQILVLDEDLALMLKPQLNDFQLLLKELNYEFKVNLIIVEEEEEDEFVLDEDVPFIESEEEEEERKTALITTEIYAEDKETLEANAEKMIKEREEERRKNVAKHVTIKEIFSLEDGDAVDFDGEVYSMDVRTTRIGPLYLFGVGQGEDGINCRVFLSYGNERLEHRLKEISEGDYVRIIGNVHHERYDNSKGVTLRSIDKLPPPALPTDDYPGEKRVELHLHTQMSVMDAVTHIDDYVKLAKNMGHEALAITDHGVVQAFPEAQKAGEKYGVKIIYGSELYLVDKNLPYIINPAPILLNDATYVVLDFETTGLSAKYDKIIEFGAVKVEKGLIRDHAQILINPGSGIKLAAKITEVTNITDAMLQGRPTIDKVIDDVMRFIGDSIIVTHNAQFDIGFLNAALVKLGRPKINNPVIDTLQLSRYVFPEARSHRLANLARNMEVHYDEHAAHRASYDAEVLNTVWQALLHRLLVDNEYLKHQDLGNLALSREGLIHLWPYHVTALVKNEEGLKALYKLISVSHTDFMAEVPKVPREILKEHREHLLLGSGCFNGEIFDAARTKDEEQLIELMAFYDFIEIQPYDNYSYLVDMERITEEQLKQTIVDITNAAKKAGKLVVATGDAHYLTPSHKLYRDVYISAKAVGGIPHPLYPYERDRYPAFSNPDMHYRSTTEMITQLEKFGVFTDEEIKDYVVTNSRKINRLIKDVAPLKKGLYKPNIANVDEKLRAIVYENAYKMYGNPLPGHIAERVEQEFNGIISNGYAVIYYLAYQIVKKANDEHHIVGSRGSVGSSLVATFAKITEVNPLPPHYYCPTCQYSLFDHGEKVKSGYDLPHKDCPNCQTPLIGEGQNIPFATFLGFEADKVPDIDLNFPEDYQKQAHDFTKELFGEKNVYRAGTISKVKLKTGFGYVRGYYERLGEDPNMIPRSSLGYIASKIEGVKRTTGQHPGGIIVIPNEFEVYDFTPTQYPADRIDSEWLTTHLDYDAIHDNVLKLDLLGHKDPVVLKKLTDLVNISYEKVPLNDKAALSLFSSVEALNLAENILDEKTGALGLPEFGTSFVRQMLESAKPTTFNDLIIVSGLSHGRNVWLNNAEKIIADGIATLDGVIGCRDDIMTYLMSLGMDGKDAFSIMEKVRREKVFLSEDDKARMRFHGVPDYYIESCDQIQYLFPRAHAAAYVIMAVKVAWFKIHHPLEYYATFFTIRGENFDIKTMISDKKAVVAKINEFVSQSKTEALNQRDQNIEENLRLTVELLERGFKIKNVDLYKSSATEFLIDHANKALIPPFVVLSGLGATAAESVVEARADGVFKSIEDLLQRTRLNSQNIELLRDLGTLKDLPEDNQISLFEFLDD